MVLAYCVVSPTGRIALMKAFGSVSEEGRDKMMSIALERAAEKFNEDMPMMINDETRADSVESEGTELIYNQTLMKISSWNVDAYSIKGAFEEPIVSSVCDAEDMEFFIESGVTISFAYYGNDSNLIFKISVDKSTCEQATLG